MKIINVMTDRIYIKYDNIDNLSTNQHIYCLEKVQNTYSSVSGYVEGITELYSEGSKVKAISILNDFKDDYKEFPFTNKEISKNISEVVELLKKYGYNDNFKTLDVLNIDLSNEAFLSIFNDEVEELLKFLDEFCVLFDIKKVNFIYKNKTNISKLNSYIGSYLNFKLSKKAQNGNNLIITINEFYDLYNILIRNKCLTETFININLKNKINYNVKVKIGSNLSEIIKILNINTNNNRVIISENKLYDINNLNYLISKNVTDIYIK